MKKQILTLAIVAISYSVPSFLAHASNFATETVVSQDDLTFTSIAVTNLPTDVKNAALKTTEGIMAITEAKVATTDDGNKVYEVTLNDGQGSETTLYFNEDGSAYKK